MKYLLPLVLLIGCHDKSDPQPYAGCTQYRNINIETVGGCDQYGLCGVGVYAYSYQHPAAPSIPMGLGRMRYPSRNAMVLDAYVCRVGEKNSTKSINEYQIFNYVPEGYVLQNPDDHLIDAPCCYPEEDKKNKTK